MDVPLNPVGLEQVKSIKLDDDFDLIFSSPMKRCLQTAEVISHSLNKPLIVKKELTERDKGSLEGKPHPEIERILAEKMELDFSLYGGETIEEVRRRIRNFLKEILAKYRDKKILVVTHMGIVRVLAKMYGLPPINLNNAWVQAIDIPEE